MFNEATQALLYSWQSRQGITNSTEEMLIGMQEELGELAHHVLKRSQGIRGTPEEHAAGIRKEIADVLIYAYQLASNEGFDLDQAVRERVETIVQRTLKTRESR